MNKKKIMLWLIIGICLTALVIWILAAFAPKLFYKDGYSVQQQQSLVLVAHRGGASLGPENTLACIAQGMDAGADMIEIDIHLSKDGRIIVCHDQSVDRTTNGKGLIRDMTFEQLRGLLIVDDDGKETDQRLPTLVEVLQLINGKCEVLIEIKRTEDIYQGIEKLTLETIDSLGARDWCIVQSFNDSVLETMHRLDPTIPLEKLIIGIIPGTDIMFDGTLNRFSFEKYHYIQSFNIWMNMASRRFIDKVHRNGKKVKIWTVGAPDQTPNVPTDAIITNYPQLWNHGKR